jgi:glutamate-1-semialdehyde 2,1-aminomutase
VIPPQQGFLEHLRRLADQSGALLVADEVISGFRVAPGGAQQLLGFDADLTLMGKVLGGGLPAAAYGGSRELMGRIAPAGDVYQAGTLSGNPLAVAAGLATLELLDEPAYARLAELTEMLAAGLREAIVAAAAEQLASVASAPGLVTLFMRAEPPSDFSGAQACDLDAYAKLCRRLLERGVYPPPSQFEAWFVSLAHERAALQRTAAAVTEALIEVVA